MLITVFTPTYNRAYLLPRLYQSLVAQTNKDFKWLVVDDGSSDETRELVASYMNENIIAIDYVFQENQGMHGAHNTAFETITTPYCMCIDSDDFLPPNAIELVSKNISRIGGEMAGLVGLDADLEGNIVGTTIPAHLEKVKINELYSIHGVSGDKKMVYKTKIIASYPKYPLFKGERFVPLDYKYLLIDQDYDLLPLNEVLCIVEYQQDGSTKNILSQYVKNPKGFAFSRISRVNYDRTFYQRFKNAIHLVSSAIFAKDLRLICQTKRSVLVLAAFPFGLALNFYIRLKTQHLK